MFPIKESCSRFKKSKSDCKFAILLKLLFKERSELSLKSRLIACQCEKEKSLTSPFLKHQDKHLPHYFCLYFASDSYFDVLSCRLL